MASNRHRELRPVPFVCALPFPPAADPLWLQLMLSWPYMRLVTWLRTLLKDFTVAAAGAEVQAKASRLLGQPGCSG